MTPLIDVVILTWNDQAHMRAAVESVLSSVGVDAAIIVVDNGSEPPAEVPTGVQLIRNEHNAGVAVGRNQGVRAGRAPLICVLDSDAVVEPHSLDVLSAPLLGDETIAMTGPVFVGHAPEHTAGRQPTLWRKVIRGVNITDRYVPTPRAAGATWWDVDFVIGACQMIRRSALDEVGLYDESDRFGPEDVELCARLRASGHRVVQVTGVVCHHTARRSHKRLLSRRGLRHVQAVARYYARRLVGKRS